MPCFEAHQPAPPSSSPPVGESSFVTCHVSKLTNQILPLSRLQRVSPRLLRASFTRSPNRSSQFLPSSVLVLVCDVPRFQAHQPAPPSSSPPVSESSLVTCHVSKLTNPFLPLPPLQLVSPRLCRATFQSSPTCSSLFLPSSK